MNSAPGSLMASQEDRVEHDGFGKGHAEERQDNHLPERAGIAPDRLGGFHADQTDPDGRSQAGQTDLKLPVISANIGIIIILPLFHLFSFLSSGSRD